MTFASWFTYLGRFGLAVIGYGQDSEFPHVSLLYSDI